MKKYNICISGICGFIGSNLANTLHKMGHHVVGYDNMMLGDKGNLDFECDVEKAALFMNFKACLKLQKVSGYCG